MRSRMLAGLIPAALLLACERQERPEAADAPAVAERGSTGGLFVPDPAGGAQLVFVWQDRTGFPAERTDAVFVPMSTFSVERDGIPNEFPAPDSMAALLQAAGVGAERVVIVGDPIPAGRAWAAFDYLGLGDRAALLDGGHAALASAPAAGSTPAPAAGATPSRTGAASELDIDVREDMIVDAGWVHARLNDAGVAILDARPPAEFSGETPGDGIDRPGHIPGARNVFWQTLVESADNPRLRNEAELRRIFEEAGVDRGDTIVAYCRTGGQASFLYTVARHLGYDVRLYDGSFIDWSRTDYPVER